MSVIALTEWKAWARSGPAPSAATQPFPAAAPGSIHTDLMGAGLLEDPLLADHELDQRWVGLVDWSMEAEFDLEPGGEGGSSVTLCFDGVDTFARILLNDTEVARVENMHRRHRLDIADAVQQGRNRVRVDFDAPLNETNRRALEQGMRPHVNDHPYNAVRKMACSFGWDWGPDTVTSGLWRPVWVEVDAGPNLEGTMVSTRRQGDSWALQVELAEDVDDWTVHLTGPGVETQATGEGRQLDVPVDGAQLWWPRGFGDQPLYTVTIEATRQGRTSRAERRIGFREVQAVQAPDELGHRFHLQVNDEPVWVRGMNWIPDDPFPHRVDEEAIRRQLAGAVDLGCNLIRVWGGGTWESDTFYQVCDELGLLVWQDALFACAFYSEEEPLRSEVEAEVRDNLVRLHHHPSLALLCGGNECESIGAERGFQDGHDFRHSWGLGYWREIIPTLASELVPQLAYIPNSPFSPRADDMPNDPAQGTMHVWDVWNSRPYEDYRTHRPRFAAEFGWQAPPAWTTLTETLEDDPLTPESPQLLIHQKAGAGQLKLQRGIVRDFGLQTDMRSWHWAAQLVQARALRVAIDWFRSLDECRGAIIWQLNDCWPVLSWAVVDSNGWRKPAYYSLQQAFSPRTATVPEPEGAWVSLSNHTTAPWEARGEVIRYAADGTELAREDIEASVPAGQVVRVPRGDDLQFSSPGEFLRLAVGDAPVAHSWASANRTDQAAPAQYEVRLDGDTVELTAQSVLQEVWLAADEVRCEVTGDQLVSLLPGEVHRWVLAENPDSVDVVRKAIRTANELVTSG